MASDLPSLEDWMQLLGLTSIVPDLLTGRIGTADAEEAITAAKDQYPDVSQDYVAVLDQALSLIATVKATIDEQSQGIQAFNDAAAPYGLYFAHDTERLLTADDAVRLADLQKRLQRLLDQKQQELDRAKRDAEHIQNEISALLREAEEITEDATDGVREAAEEAEAALADYEEELEKAETERRASSAASEADVEAEWEDPFEDDPRTWDWAGA